MGIRFCQSPNFGLLISSSDFCLLLRKYTGSREIGMDFHEIHEIPEHAAGWKIRPDIEHWKNSFRDAYFKYAYFLPLRCPANFSIIFFSCVTSTFSLSRRIRCWLIASSSSWSFGIDSGRAITRSALSIAFSNSLMIEFLKISFVVF